MIDEEGMLARERDAEISKLVRSINELAVLFKELSVLVIDQGTIIDRIDYNIEQTLEHTKKGNTHLQGARKAQESARARSCLMCLIAFIVLCVIVLVFKHA